MTRRTARVLSMVTTLANVVYVQQVASFMVSEHGPKVLTTSGYVFMACTMVASTALACLLIWCWHSLARHAHSMDKRPTGKRSARRPAQRRRRWRGDEYTGSVLDYSYLREDPAREAMHRTI